MRKIHTGWKVALGACLVVVCAAGIFLFLVANGGIHLETPARKTVSLPLPDGVSEKDLCMDDKRRDYCWKEILDQPGCFVWADPDWPEQEFQWSGSCSEGLAEGPGTWITRIRLDLSFVALSFFESRQVGTGVVVRGRRQGDWSARFLGGRREERSYALGFRHGVWMNIHTNGETEEVHYQLGERSGFAIRRNASGDELPPPWERGKGGNWPYGQTRHYKHGMRRVAGAEGEIEPGFFIENSRMIAWRPAGPDEAFRKTPFRVRGLTGRFALSLDDGTVAEGPFVDGEMYGEWTLRLADGTVLKGSYADNRRTGAWTETHPDGRFAQGSYRGRHRHGDWVFRHANAEMHEGPYKWGIREGVWVFRESGGRVVEGSYLFDRPNGEWVYRYPDGTVERGFRIWGTKHGEWTTMLADGTAYEGFFREGKEYGEWIVTDPYGTEARGKYDDGEPSEDWVRREAEPELAEGPYTGGKRHGIWTVRHPDGSVIEEHWEYGELLTTHPDTLTWNGRTIGEGRMVQCRVLASPPNRLRHVQSAKASEPNQDGAIVLGDN